MLRAETRGIGTDARAAYDGICHLHSLDTLGEVSQVHVGKVRSAELCCLRVPPVVTYM